MGIAQFTHMQIFYSECALHNTLRNIIHDYSVEIAPSNEYDYVSLHGYVCVSS